MSNVEENISTQVDSVLTKFQQSTILYYPYVTGTLDVYKQRTKTFGTAVTLVGRAIWKPTPEQISVIGSTESYDLGCVFSRKEMLRKLPSFAEGEWMDVTGEIGWNNRRFRIEEVRPSGQVQEHFLLIIVLGNTIQGSRDS